MGRDLLSRLFVGTRISLLIAFIAAMLDIIFGVTYGLISGLLGGRIDNVMQRFLEILSGIPNLVVMILMLVVLNLGSSRSWQQWRSLTGFQWRGSYGPKR